ncbi:PTS sugar transporter subunit IIA [Pantoea sp. B65]|uniref:PTS sugar transporter subunit IIA n=1 Tax=Pantoea sp. B65 TaxID=2813359 RepID=UPI0039B62E70
MREVYIASHGKYAEGIVSGLDLLIGSDHGITAICAYCGDIGSTSELAQRFDLMALEAARRGNELVLFTDMAGGSVNNTAVQVMVSYAHMHVISGANLIMLMEFCLSEHRDTPTRVKDAMQMAIDAMQYMNLRAEVMTARQNLSRSSDNDADDFFAVEDLQ